MIILILVPPKYPLINMKHVIFYLLCRNIYHWHI